MKPCRLIYLASVLLNQIGKILVCTSEMCRKIDGLSPEPAGRSHFPPYTSSPNQKITGFGCRQAPFDISKKSNSQAAIKLAASR